MYYKVKDMRAQVVQYPAAIAYGRVAPCIRSVPVGKRRVQKCCAEICDAADAARVKYLFGAHKTGPEPVLKGHLTAHVMFFCKLCKLIRLRRGYAQRLVAVNMLSRKNCRLCLRIMKRIGRADVYYINFGIACNAVKVACCVQKSPAARLIFGFQRISAAECVQNRAEFTVVEKRYALRAEAVGLSHKSAADDGNIISFHAFPFCSAV